MVIARRTTSSNRRHSQLRRPSSSHNIDSVPVTLDHDYAVADAGLLLTGTLVKRFALEAFTDEAVVVGYRPGRKLASLGPDDRRGWRLHRRREPPAGRVDVADRGEFDNWILINLPAWSLARSGHDCPTNSLRLTDKRPKVGDRTVVSRLTGVPPSSERRPGAGRRSPLSPCGRIVSAAKSCRDARPRG